MPEISGVKETQPHGTRHIIFFGLFFIYGFGLFGYPFWYVMRNVLPHSISLANESSWFSPTVAGTTRVHYVGFIVPLIVSIISVVAIYTQTRTERRSLTNGGKTLFVVIPISFLISQYTILGIFVSVGLTDPILLIAFSLFVYNFTLHRTTTQAALLSYPLGFLLGFISDLESIRYFGGVFGGYGFGDGDFVFPLAFLVGALLLSLTRQFWTRFLGLNLGLSAKSRSDHPMNSLSTKRCDPR